MPISLKHSFVSFQLDGPDTSLVQPSNWNEQHVLEQATARLLGRVSPGDGPTEEIPLGAGLSLLGGDLQAVFASQAEAEAGVISDKLMSPLTTKQAAEVVADDVATALIAALAGKVVQVVQAQTSTNVTVSAATYTDTTLTATITPRSTTSKILALVDQSVRVFDGTRDFAYGGVRLLRGSTVIHEPATDGSDRPFDYGLAAGGSTSANLYTRAQLTVLDAPATAAPVTYKTQGRPYFSDASMAFQPAGSPNGTSRITLLEVAE